LEIAALSAALTGHRRIGIDTNILIYFLEANPKYLGLAEVVVDWMGDAGHSAVTSTLTMTDILVGLYRRGDIDHVRETRARLLELPHLDWLAPQIEVGSLAAELRATHRLHAVDAVQLATAINGGATCLVGNDAAYKRVRGLEVLLLDDFAKN
jgi:predicted nucleic acid-binding protein